MAMLKILHSFILFPVVLLLVSLTACDEEDNKPVAGDLILCEDPRPQICTSEYDPVCSVLANGAGRTDATACTACSDTQVAGYIKGACEDVSVIE